MISRLTSQKKMLQPTRPADRLCRVLRHVHPDRHRHRHDHLGESAWPLGRWHWGNARHLLCGECIRRSCESGRYCWVLDSGRGWQISSVIFRYLKCSTSELSSIIDSSRNKPTQNPGSPGRFLPAWYAVDGDLLGVSLLLFAITNILSKFKYLRLPAVFDVFGRFIRSN